MAGLRRLGEAGFGRTGSASVAPGATARIDEDHQDLTMGAAPQDRKRALDDRRKRPDEASAVRGAGGLAVPRLKLAPARPFVPLLPRPQAWEAFRWPKSNAYCC